MKEEKREQRTALQGKKATCRKNKTVRRRLDWKEREMEAREGGGLVVKGISKRVIVVKAPDERIFEQAIFIIREDFAGQAGVSEKEILRQARKAADEYLRGNGSGSGRFFPSLRAPLYAAAGAAATGAAWLALHMVRL